MIGLNCVNLMNFGPVTLEFTKVKDVHLVVSFLNKNFRQIISVFTGPIFTMFSPFGRYLVVDY